MIVSYVKNSLRAAIIAGSTSRSNSSMECSRCANSTAAFCSGFIPCSPSERGTHAAHSSTTQTPATKARASLTKNPQNRHQSRRTPRLQPRQHTRHTQISRTQPLTASGISPSAPVSTTPAPAPPTARTPKDSQWNRRYAADPLSSMFCFQCPHA